MKNILLLPHVIAIDGGSSTGKSSTARGVAQRNGYLLLNSGALYRGIGYKTFVEGLKFSDISGIVEIAKTLTIEFVNTEIFLDGKNYTAHINAEETGTYASQVAQIKEVRLAIRELQLSFRKFPGLVAEGRDMAELFQTPFCYFLKTSVEKKAERRFLQLKAAGANPDYQKILKQLQERDYLDINRSVNPLRQHENALCIDNTYLKLEEAVEMIDMDYRVKKSM